MSDRILVLNGMSYAKAIEGLGDIGYDDDDFLKHPNEYKLVLFTGGEDVSPPLYSNSSPKGLCLTNPMRDVHETEIFKIALANGVLMAGICRGVQFLNVMAGGRLMHHITGHSFSNHVMRTEVGGLKIPVNSLHHQMVIPNNHAKIIGTADTPLSRRYIGDCDNDIEYYGAEVEVAIFPEIGAFGVQYHPEIMAKNSDGYDYFHKMVENALDLDWRVFIAAYTEGLADVHFLTVHDTYSSIGRRQGSNTSPKQRGLGSVVGHPRIVPIGL